MARKISLVPHFCAFFLTIIVLFFIAQSWNNWVWRKAYYSDYLHLDKKILIENFTLDSISHPLRFEPLGIKLEHFVALSSYRSGRKSFVVIGESSSEILKQFGTPIDFCIFEKNEIKIKKRINTSASVIKPGDNHDKAYETIIIECIFDKEGEEANFNGGLLFIVKKGWKEMMVLNEKDEDNSIVDQSFKYEVVFCCAPFHGHAFNSDIFATWLDYHDKIINVGHYYFYNHGYLTKRMEKIIRGYIGKGKASVSKFVNSENYDSWYFHQVTSANDCLYKTRFISRWSFFIDFDEFVFLPPSLSRSFPKALASIHNAPWVSLGSVIWNINKCGPRTKNESLLASMMWHAPGPSCRLPGSEFDLTGVDCLGSLGYRKFFVNPAKVKSLTVHSPADFDGQPVHWNSLVNSGQPKLYHFRGVLTRRRLLCKVKVNRSVEKDHSGSDVYDSAFTDTLQWINSLNFESNLNE